MNKLSLLVWAEYLPWDVLHCMLAVSVPSVDPKRNQGDQLRCEILALQISQDMLICPKPHP